MNYTDNLNFKGKYRNYDAYGKKYKYAIGDTVEFNGFYYVATSTIEGIPPNVKNSGWEVLSSNSNFYIQSTTPTGITYKGDRWFDTSTGTIYTRLLDENGMHWVEL